MLHRVTPVAIPTIPANHANTPRLAGAHAGGWQSGGRQSGGRQNGGRQNGGQSEGPSMYEMEGPSPPLAR